MTKKILGLDLGTNSIGWALVEKESDEANGKILGMGSRIIPMSQDIISDFGKGNSISQTADRTRYRSMRRLLERNKLRRERLHRILHILGFLPQHFSQQIDSTTRLGKFIPDTEPKIAYDNKHFIFQTSFKEMLAEFKNSQPELLKDKNGNDCLIPYDWTIFYLRKKAISQKIEKEELAWIILNFNQKRGYYQLRGEESEENTAKSEQFHSLLIVDVVADTEKNNKGETWYSLHLENGWTYRRSSKFPLFDWKGKIRDFIVTTTLNEDGTEKVDKDGQVKRSFRAPGPEDWNLLKKKTEYEIDQSKKTVGTFIYNNLLKNPKQKIKGKLVRTIERKYYKDELKLILEKQATFHPELTDEGFFKNCINELYRTNIQHQQILAGKDLLHLIIEDILFYQRPLRSQKSTISGCSLETRKYKDESGNEITQGIKVIAKSNPYFQEFRLLQWLRNLEIYDKATDEKVTNSLLSSVTDWESVLDFLNEKKEIEQKPLIEFILKRKLNLKKVPKSETEKYRWNYVEDKAYPCNETRQLILSKLSKITTLPPDFLSFPKEMELWHMIYSINDKYEFEQALKKYAIKNQLDPQSFIAAFIKTPPLTKDYGNFSEKAIKKLLPLMRFGRNWNWQNIDSVTQISISKIMTGEYDEAIKDRVRQKAKHLSTEKDFQMLPLWLAQYIVYGRHAESASAEKWKSPIAIDNFLRDFKQHSLRNPIVEQIITETARVVKDIWIKYGNGEKDFFSEIHIELGRELKNTAEERKKITTTITENENTNMRIKALLAEMVSDKSVDNVRPNSPNQHEILKIYEEGVLNSDIEIEDDILKISRTSSPSSSELKRYKLWLEQKYRSPYTGEIIPLNKLFTPEYEIEHIIPQSRYFDDSFSNKVICEAAVNKLKDNNLGFEFIKKFHGYKVTDKISILEISDYEAFVKQHYAKNRSKRSKLLLEEIPDQMIERQMNDTRYISKFVMNLLSNIVRSDSPESNDDGVNSKNIIAGNGKITTRLKHDWGLNDVWNDLILPRFERMNQITGSSAYTSWNENLKKHLPAVPIEESKGFSKKRIDHRHHAMDALVIACATRDHINLLNNESAKSDSKRYDLNRKLRNYERVIYKDSKTGQTVERDIPKDFRKPWGSFTADAKNYLENLVISFKQNTRIINKATNYYESYKDEDGNLRLGKDGKPKKGLIPQKGANWAIRKALHKETVSGIVILSRIKVARGKILTATRKSIDPSFDKKAIESITDTAIQKILINYLQAKNNNAEIAFSAEGIEEMNQNIRLYNDGKWHQPINKVRVFEQGNKFSLGESGNKKVKFVEAAKGTNLFFGIYADQHGKRSYDTIPLNLAIERLKQGVSSVPETNEKGDRLLFSLSPNDLVFVPQNGDSQSELTKDSTRIYKVVSFTKNECHFIPCNISSLIKSYDPKYKFGELGSLNKQEVTIDGLQRIKEVCIKIKVDRLGNILKV